MPSVWLTPSGGSAQGLSYQGIVEAVKRVQEQELRSTLVTVHGLVFKASTICFAWHPDLGFSIFGSCQVGEQIVAVRPPGHTAASAAGGKLVQSSFREVTSKPS